jgi:hypothetical protein
MKPAEELLSDYAATAKKHMEASNSGNYRVANRAYDRLVKLRRELMDRGASGRSALLSLLGHVDPEVRVWAAADCLPVDTTKAEQVLSDLVHCSGIVALTAETTLDEWKAGRLTF